MTYRVPSPPGTSVLVLDRSDRSVVRLPVVAFDVTSSVAYPILPVAFGGLLTATRALLINDLIVDRGFDIPFDSEEAWVMWAMSVEPGSERAVPSEGSPEELERKRNATVDASVHGDEQTEPAESVAEAAERIKRETAASKPANVKAEKPRKTFASKSFWSRVNMMGVTEAVEIEAGQGLPRDSEGFEKIKRDDFAALKKRHKAGDESIDILGWNDGPVLPDADADAVFEELSEPEDEDFGGLV